MSDDCDGGEGKGPGFVEIAMKFMSRSHTCWQNVYVNGNCHDQGEGTLYCCNFCPEVILAEL